MMRREAVNKKNSDKCYKKVKTEERVRELPAGWGDDLRQGDRKRFSLMVTFKVKPE